MTDDKKKKGWVSRTFDEWSRPIGVILFVLMGLAQVYLDAEFHLFVWGVPGFLIAGEAMPAIWGKK